MDRPTQVASVFAAIGADLSGFNKGLRQARQDLGGFQGFMQTAGKNMSNVGRKMMLGITAPILGLGAKMVHEASQFEAGINILEVAGRAWGLTREEMSQAARTVGRDVQLVGIDAMEASEAMTNFAKAGLGVTQVFGDVNRYLEEGTNCAGAMRAAVDLAAASNLNLAQTSDALAIAMATYGLEAEQVTGIADSFVGAADASVAEVSGLVQAMSTFGPTAAQFGWSLEDTNIALALLSERGIRGSEAGTALRSMMTNMMRGTKKTVEALKALNLSLYDQEGAMKGLPDIIGELVDSFEGLTEEERNHYIQTLAGTYGMKAMQTLLAEGQEGWDDMAQGVADAATAQEVGTKRTEGFAGKMENLQGAVQDFMLYAGVPFLERFATPAVEKLTGLVFSLSELDASELETLGKTLAGIAAAPAALWVLGSLAQIVGTLGIAGSALAASGLGIGFSMWLQTDQANSLKSSLYDLADTNPALKKLLDTLERFSAVILAIQEKGLFGFVKELITGPPAERQEESIRAFTEAYGRGPGAKLLIPPPFTPPGGAGALGGFPLLPEVPLAARIVADETAIRHEAEEAASSFVGGAQDFLGILPAVGEVGGERGIRVPAGVSLREEQIREAGLKAGRIYGEAFQEAADALVGGLLGTSFLAAARARGTR